MPKAIPTKEELRQQLRGTLQALLPEIDASPDTDAGVRIEMLVEAVYGIHYENGGLYDDLFASDKTRTEALDKHAEARGLTRKGATIAAGTSALKLTGTVGTAVVAGLELTAGNGSIYETTTGGTLDSNGELLVSVESVTRGTQANRDIGETLTLVSPPAGVSANASVVVAIDGAEDQETDGQLLVRILDAYQNPPAGGRGYDYRQWAKAVEGVLTAYVYGPSSSALTGRRGLGIVDVAILGSGSGADRVPTQTVADLVDDYIEERRPITTRNFAVLLPGTQSQDIDLQITPKTGYGWDWTKLNTATVSGWVAGTKTLALSTTVAAMSADVAVGDRMLVDGQLAQVVTLPGGSDVVLQPLGDDGTTELDDFVRTPGSGDTVYPAGPLTSPSLLAIKALFDGLGPARGTAPDPEQDWEDTLRVLRIHDAIAEVDGVRDATLVTPSANVTPTDHAPSGTVDLLIPGVITPRPA